MSRIYQIARELDEQHKRNLHHRAEVSDLFRILGFLTIYWLIIGVSAAIWLFRDPILAWWRG